ncbi:TniQ family protein [Streptomyces sp. NBC_01255]|uniref:TniQ family protein n=1 Tax=Streptomyces sp. NBC_01255 TaxID=2903798 RepID=UPI002E312E48|nr:TniQ family protein [Streptomyces sp. NBC_01255]
MTETRVLPLRIPILDGESLDSWLETLGRRNGLTFSAFLRILGLPGNYFTRSMVSDLPVTVLRELEIRTGLPAGRLDQAVIGSGFPFGPRRQRRCRFCPQCLAEQEGRWLLKWWLPWTFACTTHEALLHDTCPGCGEGVRVRLPGHTLRFPAGTCTIASRLASVCGTDLTNAKRLPLAADHPLLAAQHHVDVLLADPSTAYTVLADLSQCTSWLMHTIDDDDLQSMGRAVRECWRRRPLATRTPADRVKPLGAAVSGVVAHAALPFLVTPDDALAAHAVHGLRARRDTPNKVIPRGMTAEQWSQLSPGTQRRFLQAGDRITGALDRVRFSSSTPRARVPEPGEHSASARIRHLPQLLWPGWTVRLMPREGMQENLFRGIAAALLLLPGEPELRARGITDRLGPHLPSAMTVTLQRALKSGHPDVLTALCNLAHHLDDHGSPIDYERRRHLIPAAPISPDQWRELCFRTGTQPGEQLSTKTTQAPRYLNAQRYLHQLLTGADLTDPRHPLALRSAPDRSRYFAFPPSLTLDQRDALHQHAIGILHDLNINEPLTWEPPQECADGLDLPGRHLGDIDLEEVRRIVITEQRAPREAAKDLDTTLTHIRFTLEQVLREPREWARSSSLGSWRLHQQAKEVLTTTFLQREYIDGDKTLAHIAQETGIPRHIAIAHARTLGFSIRRTRKPFPIDEPWLREQYLTRKRSTYDIAEELGTEDETVRRRLKHLKIPLRPPGVHSRTVMTKIDTSLPRDVRSAVEGTLHGWLRLHRFQIAMRFPSLDSAARHLKTEPNALVTQFRRLERDIGKSLFTRAAFGRPQQPTRQGRRLLRDLEADRVEALMTASLPHHHTPAPPDDHVLEAAHAKFQTRRNPGPPTPFDDIAVERIRITRPMLALLHDLLARPQQEFYGAEVIARTGLEPGSVYPQLKRLERAGWLTSRLEDDITWMNRATPGRGPGKRRTFYTLTAEGHRAARHETQHRTAA